MNSLNYQATEKFKQLLGQAPFNQTKVVQRLQDRAFARAVWAKQQRDGPKVDLLPGTDTLEVFNFNPADAHSGTSEFAAECTM